MRQLRCLLAGVAGAIGAIIAIFITLIVFLSMVSAKMSSPQGEIGWDPVSLGRQQPLLLVILLSLILGIIACGFAIGYRSQVRRIRNPNLAGN